MEKNKVGILKFHAFKLLFRIDTTLKIQISGKEDKNTDQWEERSKIDPYMHSANFLKKGTEFIQ